MNPSQPSTNLLSLCSEDHEILRELEKTLQKSSLPLKKKMLEAILVGTTALEASQMFDQKIPHISTRYRTVFAKRARIGQRVRSLGIKQKMGTAKQTKNSTDFFVLGVALMVGSMVSGKKSKTNKKNIKKRFAKVVNRFHYFNFISLESA